MKPNKFCDNPACKNHVSYTGDGYKLEVVKGKIVEGFEYFYRNTKANYVLKWRLCVDCKNAVNFNQSMKNKVRNYQEDGK
jgi:hypothetical protein